MNTHHSSLRVFAAALTMVIAVPLTTHAIVSATGHYSADLQERALGNQENIRALTRAMKRLNARCQNAGEQTTDRTCQAYRLVQQECLARQGLRTSTGCPEINDIQRIMDMEAALVRGESLPSAASEASSSVSSVHTAATPEISWDDLTQSERLTLRRFIRLQYCSTKLPNAMYVLCIEAVGNEQGTVPSGLLNDLAKVQADQDSGIKKSLKDRIEMTVPRAK